MADIAPLLYTTKRSDMATCYLPYCMLSYESVRKSCTNQAAFLGPVVGGWRVVGSAMHLPLADSLWWLDSGAQRSSSTAGGLRRPYHNSGQLFERSDVVDVISVHPHEMHCFITPLPYTTTNIPPCRCHITPFGFFITPFFWYTIENLRSIA